MPVQLKDAQTFRVFFSSPFKGMEDEREELTRKYFPEIQHKCAEVGLQFVPVDMRWGISEQSAQEAQTINICLMEIDRSDMLVGFFGQRYGWYGQDSLLQENFDAALGKYPWLDQFRNASVTELELRHGHLNSPGAMPAVVCFRSKGYDDLMKDAHPAKKINFEAEDETAVTKLEALRKEVTDSEKSAIAVHLDYSNPFEGARLMFEAVDEYLEEHVLKQKKELSQRDEDLAPHRAFGANRTTLYGGNPEDHAFLNNALDAVKPLHSEDASSAVSQPTSGVLILGPAGCGKSALLCNWIQDVTVNHPDVITICYHIGCGPNTRSSEELLGFVYGELEYHLGEDGSAEDAGTEKEDASATAGVDAQSKTNNGDDQKQEQSTDHSNKKIPEDNSAKPSDAGDATADTTEDNGNKSADQGESSVDDEDKSASSGSVPTTSGDVSADKKEESADKGDKPEDKGNKGEKLADKEEKSADKENKSKDKESDDKEVKKEKRSRPKGKELQHGVLKKLEVLVQKGHKVVLVFDAVNRQVAKSKVSKKLHWLPEKLPQGVLCVLSTDDADQDSIKKLQEEMGFQVLRVKPLSEEAQQKICVQALKHSGKELSKAQLQRITDANQTENPLFLKIVLAELSIFGYFRKLDQKIDSLMQASNIKELIHNCLERFEADYNVSTYDGNLVGDILTAIYVSHQGLTESEIMNMFHIHSGVWAPLYFAIEFFLVSNLGNLGFAFIEFQEAVKERYIKDNDAEAKARMKLINYFDGVRKQNLQPWTNSKKLSEKYLQHAAVELVWLQRKQNDKRGLLHSLSDLAIFTILDRYHELELFELWQWIGLKWSEISCILLKSLDCAIADCYLAKQDGKLDTNRSPGVMLRYAVGHMRSFFSLANYLKGEEQFIKREIRFLEFEGGGLDEDKRKELLRDARYALACNYATQDLYDEAKVMHESNMADYEQALAEGEDHELRKLVAYTNNGLGLIYMNSGDYDKAIEYMLKSADFHNKWKDRNNEASSYTNLGLTYMYKQEFQTALDYMYKAKEAYEESQFGMMSLELGNLYTNIGLVHRRMKQLDKAEEGYLKSLEIKANAVGWDHVVVATAYMNLGTLEMHRSNFAKAEEWTRKAIAVYQANEFEVTKKEYRRCRENLFANVLKQNKYEEILPFYIEIFDILNSHNWMDECLASFHRKMALYMIENKPDLLDKAEEICFALIHSSKVHPDNYLHLFSIDVNREEDESKVMERPSPYGLKDCMDKFPQHSQYTLVAEIRLHGLLLPKKDKEEIQNLIRHLVASYTDSNYNKVDQITKCAVEEDIADLWVECMKLVLEENPENKSALQLFLRVCVYLERPEEVIPYVEPYVNKLKNGEVKVEDVKPSRLRLDVGKILVAMGDNALARQCLLMVTSTSRDDSLKDEASRVLATLPQEDVEDSSTLVTRAA